MILRRVIEHVKAQNWTAVALDFVIVVVGVFIGIQVSNWNAVQHERKREAQIVGNLISDLNEIERIANRTAEIYDGRVKSGIRLMTFLRSDAARPADQAQFEDDLGAVSSAFPAIARSPTIIELLASGNTGLIRDDELRLAIIKFDREMISAEAANAGNVAAIMTFLDRMKPEYNVLTVSLALRRESGMATMPAQPITSTPAFINWGAKYGKML